MALIESHAPASAAPTNPSSVRRSDTSPLLRALREQVAVCPRGSWVLSADGLPHALGELTTRYRNPAAHTEALTADDYSACRQLVVANDGLMWRLVQATSV